jgi:hypothetical protein
MIGLNSCLWFVIQKIYLYKEVDDDKSKNKPIQITTHLQSSLQYKYQR